MMNGHIKKKSSKIVLVGVLKNKRDLDILLNQNWYRIPVAHYPARKFNYLAFYQPAIFGRQGKCICYYARVLKSQIKKRIELLALEKENPRAEDYYYQIFVGDIIKLKKPIKNIIPRRVCFGFTTLDCLLRSKDILQLYNIAPTEQIVEVGLEKIGINTISQQCVSCGKRRYRLDMAVFCKAGKIAIECDNQKAHSGLKQREKDKSKDSSLESCGWVVIRLTEKEILSDLGTCISKIKKVFKSLGGSYKVIEKILPKS